MVHWKLSLDFFFFALFFTKKEAFLEVPQDGLI